jgi:prevent-host-death family protein
MRTLNIHYAKTHLSRVLEEVALGEEICIAKAGKPMAMVVPYIKKKEKREPGMWEGKIELGTEFFEGLKDSDFWG